jgi:hypothetical protein
VQPYRDIAVLAGTQVLCFLFLAQFEPHFVVIHLHQSVLFGAGNSRPSLLISGVSFSLLFGVSWRAPHFQGFAIHHRQWNLHSPLFSQAAEQNSDTADTIV